MLIFRIVISLSFGLQFFWYNYSNYYELGILDKVTTVMEKYHNELFYKFDIEIIF